MVIKSPAEAMANSQSSGMFDKVHLVQHIRNRRDEPMETLISVVDRQLAAYSKLTVMARMIFCSIKPNSIPIQFFGREGIKKEMSFR